MFAINELRATVICLLKIHFCIWPTFQLLHGPESSKYANEMNHVQGMFWYLVCIMIALAKRGEKIQLTTVSSAKFHTNQPENIGQDFFTTAPITQKQLNILDPKKAHFVHFFLFNFPCQIRSQISCEPLKKYLLSHRPTSHRFFCLGKSLHSIYFSAIFRDSSVLTFPIHDHFLYALWLSSLINYLLVFQLIFIIINTSMPEDVGERVRVEKIK